MTKPSAQPHVLLSAPQLLSPRHGTTMLLLAAAAGAVNAGAFAVCDRFVTHVTGTLTRIGTDAAHWLLMLEYSMVLASFVVGAMVSVLAIQGRALRGKPPMPAAPLIGTVAVLLLAAALGDAGAFGPIGAPAEEAVHFAFLSLLAFGMGLLNATVASSTALAVRTTHMTGPASDFGVHLATAWFSDGEARRQALQLAALRGGKLVAFVAGAALMFPLVPAMGFGAFGLPALLLVVSVARSFAPISPSQSPSPSTLTALTSPESIAQR